MCLASRWTLRVGRHALRLMRLERHRQSPRSVQTVRQRTDDALCREQAAFGIAQLLAFARVSVPSLPALIQALTRSTQRVQEDTMHVTIRNATALVFVSVAALALNGCNTMHGLGKDTESVGKKIKHESREHQHRDKDDRDLSQQRNPGSSVEVFPSSVPAPRDTAR